VEAAVSGPNAAPASQVDVVIVGAGPAGLCFAKSLAATGLRIVLVERLPEPALAAPAFDGREIALTQRSVRILQRLGLWQRLPAEEIAPLRSARIFNGTTTRCLEVDPHGRGVLGSLVPNHLIRQVAYAAVRDEPGVQLRAGVEVQGVDADGQAARVRLSDGTRLEARLVVAADSRFSETRRAMGIAARLHDFGRSMLVCRMTHAHPHAQAAWEWFDHGQTLALLPLSGEHRSSVVLTLPARAMQRVQAMDDAAFGREMTRRFHQRLGRMRPISTRHVYPLVGVYPERFVAERFAVIGDAAVGMHPVTAHGFNFGLQSQDRLAAEVRAALAHGTDIAEPALLARYARAHRHATRPLYLATQAMVGLFTDDRPPARWLRSLALRASTGFPPFARQLARALADDGAASGHRLA
jgi:ubiquinone biosynthesis UbiH/UbiF/VisC/COQ6 family hydroxylase